MENTTESNKDRVMRIIQETLDELRREDAEKEALRDAWNRRQVHNVNFRRSARLIRRR